jgi:hypothetical protein
MRETSYDRTIEFQKDHGRKEPAGAGVGPERALNMSSKQARAAEKRGKQRRAAVASHCDERR